MDNKLTFRLAKAEDILDIVKMLSDDTIDATREKFETLLSDNCSRAFGNILKDSNQELTIVELNGPKVGTYQ